MKTSSAFAVVLLAMLSAQQLLAVQAAAIQFSDEVKDLMPCLGYLQGEEAIPSDACCSGARALYTAVSTRDERQETCKYLKAAFLQYNVLASAAQSLPNECGLGLSYPVTPDVDCATIP